MTMNDMQSPSLYLYGPGDARIQDHPTPRIQSPTDIIVRMGYIGVCGSDIHFWTHGGINGNNVSKTKPLIMGHEGSGTVHEVGDDAVTDLRPGHRVAVEGCYPCRTCVRCSEGLYNLCPKMKFVACPPDTHGMLTKYLKVNAEMCYKLPENVGLEEGALVEPLAVAVHAVRMVDIRPGQSVVIFGSGTIGLLCGAVAKYYGSKKVVAVDIAQSKLQFAKEFNDVATYKYNVHASAQANAQAIMEQYDLGLGADGVIEASGAESSVNCGAYVLRPGGQYVQTGLGKPSIEFPILTMSEKEIHMHGAFRYGPGDFSTARDILGGGMVPLKMLISRIFPFEQTTQAWEATKSGTGIKNMIQAPQ